MRFIQQTGKVNFSKHVDPKIKEILELKMKTNNNYVKTLTINELLNKKQIYYSYLST